MINYIHGEEITTETEYRFFGRQRRRYLRRADAVVAVSCFTRKALVRIMGVPEGKITLIHNGVNIQRFVPAEPSPELLDRHGLHDRAGYL
ncbi:MAG: glycosyltransferase [Chromatiales bacterium]|nr:glycosyltransferase [Chromatiales bacterium]